MNITFKEKLTAIKESVAKWDGISKGIIEDKGAVNCPLCALYRQNIGTYCHGCPIYKKTGKEGCLGTPYGDYKRYLGLEQACREHIALAYSAAGRFRDWLKDLYIEVSEKGEGGEKTTRWSFDTEEKINKITSFCTAASLISKTQQDKIEELEKESRSNRTYTLGRIVEFVKSINDFDNKIEELERDSKCK